MSSLSHLDGSFPIRGTDPNAVQCYFVYSADLKTKGGIPIAFPQFATQGELMLHGFVREKHWTVVVAHDDNDSDGKGEGENSVISSPPSSPPSEVVFVLHSDADTLKVWPFEFTLRYCVRLQEHGLQTTLTVTNPPTISHLNTPFRFTTCLHTYFRTTPDITAYSLSGLRTNPFVDKVDNYITKIEQHEVLTVEQASLESGGSTEERGGYVDRIYTNAPSQVSLVHNTTGALINIEKSPSFTDFVVFNPWKEGKRGSKGPDFDDEGYRHMICVEPAVAGGTCVLNSGEEWVGSQTISFVE